MDISTSLEAVSIYLIFLSTVSVSGDSDCSRIWLTGAAQQPETEGYYDYFSHCSDAPSYRHEGKEEGSSRYYYLYYFGFNPNIWAGWIVSKTPCSEDGAVLKVDDDSLDPLEIDEIWKERVQNSDDFFDNDQIKLDCEERLPTALIIGLFVSVIVTLTAIAITILICVLKFAHSKRDSENSVTAHNDTASDQGRTSVTPPRSVCSVIEPNFTIPPPYSLTEQSPIIAHDSSNLSALSTSQVYPRNSGLDISFNSTGHPPSYNQVIEEKLKQEYEQMCTEGSWQVPNLDHPFYENLSEVDQTRESSFAADNIENAFREQESHGLHVAASEQYYENSISEQSTNCSDEYYGKYLNTQSYGGLLGDQSRPSNAPSTSSRGTGGHYESADSFAMNRTCDW